MPRLRRGELWLGGSIVFTVAAIISFLVLTGLGQRMASHVAAAGVSATAATIGAISTAYNTFRRPRTQAELPRPQRSSLVAVCFVQDDTRWGQWCENRLNAAGFQARLLQFPASEGGAAAAEWVERAIADARCTLVIESKWLREAGDTVTQRLEALDRHRLGGSRVVYVVTDGQSSQLAPAQARTSVVSGIREEDQAWRLIEDCVQRSGARSDARRAREYRAVGTPSFPGSGATRANLPPITPNFVGRSLELQQLESLLVQKQGDVRDRRVAVYSMSGMGKTQLAAKFAGARREFETVWWIRAHQSSALNDDLSSLAQELGVPEVADQQELRRLLWDKLRSAKRWLLVYDGAESEERLRGLIPQEGNGSLLITSQSPNWTTVATTQIPLGQLAKQDAVALLRRHRAGRDDDVLAQIAEQLGWLPLALEQAASYMQETQCSPAHYLSRLTKNFSRTLQRGSVAYYNESAMRTYDMAREQTSRIEPLSEVLLEICSFLSADASPRSLFESPQQAPGLPEELARAIADGWAYDDALSAARRFSLLTVTADNFTMHRVVQRLIRESLSPEKRAERAAAALRLLSLAFPDDPDHPRNWDTCGELQSHCVTALDEVEEHNLTSSLSIRLNRLVGEYQRVRGVFEPAQKRLNKTAAQVRALNGSNKSESAAIELALARVCYHVPDLREAKSHAQAALRLHEEVYGPDDRRTATSLAELSQIQLELAEYDEAVRNTRRSLDIQHGTGASSSIEVGLGLKVLGILQWRLGDWDTAQATLTESASVLAAEIGADNGVTGYAQTAVGLVLRDMASDDLDALARAAELFTHAYTTLVSAQGTDHPDTLSTAIHLADTQHRKALAEFATTRDRRRLREACAPIAAEFERIMDSPPMKPQKPGRACGLVRYGHLRNSLGDAVQARELVQEARGIYLQSYGADHPYVAEALTRLIEIEYKLNNEAEAERVAYDARRIYVHAYGEQHPYVSHIDRILTSPGWGIPA